jgi:hypothetical protein
VSRVDLLTERLSRLAAKSDDPAVDWEVTTYADFAHAQAATPAEYDTSAEAFARAEALISELLGGEYVIHNFARLRAERNDTAGSGRWRGYVDFGAREAGL